MSLWPRPRNIRKHVPAKWWVWEKLPGHFHVRKPKDFWIWRAWRLSLGKFKRPAPAPKTRTMRMYDDVNLSLIPKDAEAVAGYVGGRWPTWNAIKLRWKFPKAKKLSIAISASENARCLDVEPGDATIAQAPAWVKRQHARGEKLPVLYTSASWGERLIDACTRAGLKYGKDYLWWSAHYTMREHYCGPACGFGLKHEAHATQFTDRAIGRSLDESICSPRFFA